MSAKGKTRGRSCLVVAGLVPAIPIVEAPCPVDRDRRDKPGDDELAPTSLALITLTNPKVIGTTSDREEPNMRLIAFALAAFVAGGPAAAQTWQEYNYPAYSFTVAFPAEPKIETATHQVADGRSVEAHVYSVSQNDSVLKVTVAELGNAGLDESAVIDYATKTLSQGGEVKINIPHRVYQIGRASCRERV